MLRRSSLLFLLGLALLTAFGYGVARLFILRYEGGDVYPAYSSLRPDALGAKGIYEALASLPGVTVRRNFRPLPKLKPDGPVTIVYAGTARYSYWEERELQEFDRLVTNGSRAVFAFHPFERSPYLSEINKALDESRARIEKEKEKESGDKAKKKKTGDDAPESDQVGKEEKQDGNKGKSADKKTALEKDGLTSFEDVARKWGLSFDYLPASREKQYDRRALLQDRARSLEPEISWHTALYFKDLKPEWKVLYSSEDKPVIIERNFGQGSILLAADSYFLSNEAMRAERCPQLLEQVFSGPAQHVFDEDHLGIREDPGIAYLARKYRLHGLVAGLALLAVLFIWKNSVRFLPPLSPADGDDDVVAGKDSHEGFINLLRRTIPPARILEVCTEEWRKAFAQRPRETAVVEELSAQEQSRSSRDRDPVAAYRAITRALSRH